MNLINGINKKYVCISNKITPKYECIFGLPCDLYFPVFDSYSDDVKYRNMEIFSPHQSCTYKDLPDKRDVKFYIPYLIKKDAMNSAEAEFDSFYTEDEIDRPFIETTKRRELPIQTKVVVKQGDSIMKFFVDKKLVVTGASGFMLLRMYLSPLAKDSDGEYTFASPEPPVNPENPDVSPIKPETPEVSKGEVETTPPDDIIMVIPDN